MSEGEGRKRDRQKDRPWSTVILLIGVFVLAFGLRSYRVYPEFASGDMVGAASYILDGIPDKISADMFIQREWGAVGNPLRNLLYHYSPLGAVLGFLNVILLSAVGIRITEYMWVLPMIVIGAVTPIAIYALVEKVADRRSAIVAALVIALFPMHVIQSRVLGPSYALGFLAQVLVVYTLLNYLETEKRREALCFGVFLTTAIYSDFLWVGVVPVILYATYLNSHGDQGFRKKVTAALRKLFRPDVILVPLAGFVALATASVIFHTGPLRHLNEGYGYSSFGLHIGYFYRTLLDNSGYVMGMVMTLFFFVGFGELAKLAKVSIFFLWGLIYSAPFWFHKFGQSVVAYGNYGLQAFAIFSSILLVRFLTRRGALKATGYVTIAFLLFSSFYSVMCKTYGYDAINCLGLTRWLESYAQPVGLKAAGLWLRKHTGEDDRVFVFSYGGRGMEPSNAFYYFSRTIIGKFDSPSFQDMYSFLARFKDDTDYLVIAERDYQRIRNFVETDFFLAAEIRKKAEGSMVLIFSRKKVNEVAVLDVQESSAKFDEEFADLKHLPSQLKFERSHPNPYARYYWEGFSPMDAALH